MDLTMIPVEFVLKSAKIVKRFAYLIAAIGAIVSFGTQVELITSWGIEKPFAVGIALTIDILAVCAAIALQIPGLPATDRKIVGTILVVAVGVSISANIIAGWPHGAGAAAAHAWPVIAYLLAELIASRLRNFVARVIAAQPKPQVEEPVLQPVHATATVEAPPVIPTPQPIAITAKPGSAKATILQLAAMTPPLTVDAIAQRVGTKPGWVKHVIKSATP